MVALRTLLRTHDAELRAFRRRLFSDAADSSSSVASHAGADQNGLLRQYFLKSADLSKYSEILEMVAHELNTLPRKMLDWNTPSTRLAALIDAA